MITFYFCVWHPSFNCACVVAVVNRVAAAVVRVAAIVARVVAVVARVAAAAACTRVHTFKRFFLSFFIGNESLESFSVIVCHFSFRHYYLNCR